MAQQNTGRELPKAYDERAAELSQAVLHDCALINDLTQEGIKKGLTPIQMVAHILNGVKNLTSPISIVEFDSNSQNARINLQDGDKTVPMECWTIRLGPTGGVATKLSHKYPVGLVNWATNIMTGLVELATNAAPKGIIYGYGPGGAALAKNAQGQVTGANVRFYAASVSTTGEEQQEVQRCYWLAALASREGYRAQLVRRIGEGVPRKGVRAALETELEEAKKLTTHSGKSLVGELEDLLAWESYHNNVTRVFEGLVASAPVKEEPMARTSSKTSSRQAQLDSDAEFEDIPF